MTSVFTRRAVVLLLAATLLATPLWAEKPKKEQVHASSDEVQQRLTQQQLRIQELERLVREQGALLEVLRGQLAAPNQLTLVPTSASATVPATQSVFPTQEINRLSGEVDALAEHNQQLQQQVNRLEQQTQGADKGLANRLKGLGNFSFSGDVRLRYEPFFGGTLSRDRHRERIRLRFNAIARFSDELTGGLRISSGDELDPISTNQTLTGFFQRKPIAIDRAFIQYDPNWFQPLTLTAGKFGYTWYRTELTFDNDLNPEGFSQSLSFNFQNPVFKRLTLVAFQLPFRETSGFDDSFLHGGQVQTYWKLGDRVKFAGYAAFYNWHRADPVRAAQVASALSGSSNTNAASPTEFASNFALLDLIGRLDINTGWARWPLLLQLDFVNNTRPCTNQTATLIPCNPNDRSGWWAEVQLGRTSEQHDVQFGYTFIRIEQEAVLAAFNFSDLRQPTNVVNHRFNFGYQAYRNVTLNYTLLVGRALQTAFSPIDEPWLKRLQFDVSYKF